jgi:hypothetical protein
VSGEIEHTVLEHKQGVDIVNILGALALGEQQVGKYDGATMHNKVDLALEGVVQPVREVGEHLCKQLTGEWNIVHIFQSWNDESRQWTCYYPHCCHMWHCCCWYRDAGLARHK